MRFLPKDVAATVGLLVFIVILFFTGAPTVILIAVFVGGLSGWLITGLVCDKLASKKAGGK